MADWTLTFQPDPFEAATLDVTAPVGATLADAVEMLEGDAESVELFWTGWHVPREMWAAIRPKAGQIVEARAVPGAAAGFAILGAVAGSWVAGSSAVIGLLGTTGAAIAGLAVTFAFQAVGTALFAPKTESFEASEDSPERYSVSGAQNELVPWGAVPIVMGTHRITPRMGANPYTEITGGEQYLRIVLIWGYAPVEVSDIKIGTTSIDSFEGVEWDHDFRGEKVLSLYPNDVTQEDVGVTLEESAWVERTTTDDASEALVTIAFPNGLYRVNDDGDRVDTSAFVMGEYRAVGASTWVRFHEETYKESENTALYFSKRLVFPSAGEYEIRYRRDFDHSVNSDTEETCVWLNFKSVAYGDPINAPGVAKSALRIKASEQLNSVVDRINALVSRKIQVWDGSSWGGESATSNPAAIYRDVLRGAANARATGKTDEFNLGGWYEFCDYANIRYEAYYTDQASVLDRLTEIAAAGFASPVMNGDEWSVVVDTYRTQVVQHFTPRNTSDFSVSIDYPDIPHAIRVQFANRDEDYEADEIVAYDDGYNESTATKYEVLTPGGVTDQAIAYVMGRWFLASMRLRPEQFTFTLDFENLIAQKGDLVRVTHDVALLGQATARITGIAGNVLTLDDFITFESGKTYELRVRYSDGTSAAQAVTGSLGSTKTVTLSDVTGVAVGDLVTFGETSQDSKLCLVWNIEHGDDLTAQVTCIPYDEAVYEAWNTFPEYNSNISAPVSLSIKGPAKPDVLNVVSDESALPVDMTGTPVPMILVQLQPGVMPAMNAKVTPTASYRVGWRKRGETSYRYVTESVETGTVRIQGVEAGQVYDLSIYAVDRKGATSDAVIVGGHVVAGLAARPPAVDTFRVANRGGSAYVEWTYPSIVGDVTGYEIRWHADTGITDWGRMTALATSVPRDSRSYMVPANVGSYAIKAVDALGNLSETAKFVTSNITDPAGTNVVLSFSETSSFAGTMTDVVEVGGRLQLESQSLVTDWTDLSTVTDIAPSVVSEGTYEFWSDQDLGDVYTVNVSWGLDVAADNRRNYVLDWTDLADISDVSGGTGYGEEYDVEMQISFSRDDVASGMTWSDWERFTAGEYTARHFRFRMVLTTTDPLVSPSVDWFDVQIDAPDRVERGEDVSSGAATKSITFGAAFMAAPNITIAGQDLGSGDYWTVANKTATGFDVTFRDSGGTAVDRTFDWQAIGIGKAA